MKRGKGIGKRNLIKNPKKRNILNKNKIVIGLILMLLVFSTFIIIKNSILTIKVIEKPYTPENCSNESIKKAWEFVFKGSSENITIRYTSDELEDAWYLEDEDGLGEMFFAKGCPAYYAYQINGTRIRTLIGTNIWFMVDMKSISAIEINYTQEGIENIIQNINSEEGYLQDATEFIMQEFLENKTSIRAINTSEDAKIEFESVFNISSSNWTKENNVNFEGLNISAFGFIENETLENISAFGEEINPQGMIIKGGTVFQNYSINMYNYMNVALLTKELERNFGNWTSPINTSLKNITVNVNNSKVKMSEELNFMREERSGIQKVDILENNKTIISVNINFTEEEIDWTKIILKKQDINSTRGYLIINGLNFTKNVTVDKLNNESKYVCVKDTIINSINEISEFCNSTKEYLLKCPGSININSTKLTCNISERAFKITGLAHSGIIEMLPLEEEKPCIQNWSCTDWTDIKKECGYRDCIDLNKCNNETNIPLEFSQCPICIPNWECTEYAPEKCPKSEKRTRTCTDLNECGKNQDMPKTIQTCERKINFGWIALGMGVGIIILLIILLTKKKDKKIEEPKEHPKVQSGIYKQHPNYPSKQEQKHSSNQTNAFKTEIKPPIPDEDEYYYPKDY